MDRVRKPSKESRDTWTSRCLATDKGPSNHSSSKKAKRGWRAQIDKILALYARGMTTRDIQAQLQELYGVDVSPTLISNVTEAVMDEVRQWQSRPLEPVYPIIYVDCLVVKVRENQRVINKSLYLVLAVNLDGQKELLGMWIAQTEGAKFWLSVLTEVQNRGVKDIFIACVDGLTGLPEAIETVYPQTRVQLCMVHLMRNSLRYVSYKHMRIGGDRSQSHLLGGD
jgi:putative transposase